jgi:hypothetical protein
VVDRGVREGTVEKETSRELRREGDMSGRAFGYKCFDIHDFSDNLKKGIEESPEEFHPVTMESLKEIQKSIEMAGELAHHVEWLYSGDHSEESFLRLVNETLEKYTGEDSE